MRIRLLGDVAVLATGTDGDAREVAVPGTAQRALLARLALDAGQPVRVARLADELWDGAPPDGADRQLQVRASRLRRVLGAVDGAPEGGWLRFVAGGYLLDVVPAQVDLHDHAALVDAAEAAADPVAALALLDRADGLWGPPLEEFALVDWAVAATDRAGRAHARARLCRAEALLATGDADAAVELATGLVAADPLAARPTDLLVRALWQRGDEAAALAALRDARAALAEVGLDPPVPLRELEARILRGDRPPPPAAPPRPAPPGSGVAVDQGATPGLPARGRLVGRETELADLLARVRTGRLVTLWGPGGIGKTALARAAAHELAAAGQRVRWVDLVGAADATRLVDHVRVGLGLSQRADPVDAVARWVGHRPTIVVLDNVEHLVAGATQLQALQQAAPTLGMLATSRVPLHLPDELVVSVPPLPTAGDDPATAAVALLRDVPGGVAWPDDALARLAAAVDGVPLALELLRARLHAVAPDDLVARLGDPLDVLEAGAVAGRDLPGRHRSMRATLAWSHDLLGPHGRAVLHAVGACRGPVELAALTAVAGPDVDVVAGCSELASAALLRPDPDAPPTTYAVAGAVRAWAREVLEASADAASVRDRHAAHVADLAARAAGARTGPDQAHWLARLPRWHADLLAAHARLLADGRPVEAAGLLADVGWYWRTLELTDDLLRLAPAPDVAASLPEAVRVRLAVACASSQLVAGDLAGAAAEVEAVASTDDPVLAALLDVPRAEIALRAGRPEDALALGDAAAVVLRARASAFDAGDALARASLGAWQLGDLAGAEVRTRRALRLHREAGSSWGMATVGNNLAYLRAVQGDLDGAERLVADALTTLPGLRTTVARVEIVDTAAVVAMLRGDTARARARLEESRRLLEETADRRTLPVVLARLAQVHVDLGDADAAVGLAVEAVAAARELGTEAARLDAADGLVVVLLVTGHGEAAAALAGVVDACRRGAWEERLGTEMRDAWLQAHGVEATTAATGPAPPWPRLDRLVEQALDLLDQP